MSDVPDDANEHRLITGPWDKCFGGGIATTSVTLLGGVPGAGKSTMSLQLADAIAEATKREVLYVGAEEASRDIKARFQRLQLKNQALIRIFPLGSNADLGSVLMKRRPAAFVLDSLPGLIGDDLQAAVALCNALKGYCVDLDAPAIVIDHVTKDENYAGLMALQHAVDTTMLFTVDGDDGIRELNVTKNRFGPANVSAFFEMTSRGLIEAILDDDEEDDDE
jgi:DNA repair protein RadA/Sms